MWSELKEKKFLRKKSEKRKEGLGQEKEKKKKKNLDVGGS